MSERIKEFTDEELQRAEEMAENYPDVLPTYKMWKRYIDTIRSLQAERDRYKEALEKVFKMDGYMFVKDALDGKEPEGN